MRPWGSPLITRVCVGPPAINGVSGVLDQFQINDRCTPSGEIGQKSQSGKEPASPDIHNGKGPSTIHRKSQLSNTSHPTSSSVLSGSAGSETCHPYTQTGPRLSHFYDKPREVAFVVGGAGETLERVQSETTVLLPKDSDRCFETGLGSSLSRDSDR